MSIDELYEDPGLDCFSMRVAIISDQLLCRDTLCRLAQSELQPQQLDAYADIPAFRAAGLPPADLLLFDPPPDADFGAALRAMEPEARRSHAMVLIPSPNPPMARLARRHGFRGVLPKTFDLPVAAAALRLVVAGGEYFPCFDIGEEAIPAAFAAPARAPLSRRQAEILTELEAGATNKEIARKLGISLATVKMHVRALLNLVGARNRTEAVMRLRRATL
jgi:DNA-binding NarL/FixJ family response regulator